MTDHQNQSQGDRARTAMLVIGLLALILGALVAYRGYQDAQSGASIAAALGAPDLPQNYTQLWIGVIVAVVGAVLLLIRWTIAASRR